MTRLYLTLIFCILAVSLTAQSASEFSADLEHLHATLKKTPSYKDQIKGSRKSDYEILYNRLKIEGLTAKTEFQRFSLLSQLLIPLKDNHLAFYQYHVADFPLKLSDSSFVKEYKSSPAFLTHPNVRLNLDSLEQALLEKPKDSIEGIYYYSNYFKVGLYRTNQKDSLIGVALETKNPIWKPGQVAFILKENTPNRFTAFHADIFQKAFRLNKNEKFQHRSLTESRWKKFPAGKDHVNLDSKVPLLQLKKLDNDTHYLRLGNFATSTKSLRESQTFYDTMKDSLTSKNLIVDLRNNSGGGFKASGKYLKLLKAYSKRGKLYVLINNRTFSNAEQFTLKLREFQNVKTFGETTNGTLTYGNNFGKSETMPSGKYKLYLTDMRDRGNNLPYEEIGVSPDVHLAEASDWIDQVVKMIK